MASQQNGPETRANDIILFYANKTELVKRRFQIWGGIVIGAFLIIGSSNGSYETTLVGLAVLMLLGIGYELIGGTPVSSKKPLISVDRDGIVSPIFDSRTKHYCWGEIEGVFLSSNSNHSFLELHLNESSGVPDKRLFWNRNNPCKPRIILNAFAGDQQHEIARTIEHHIEWWCLENEGAVITIQDDLGDEKAFISELKSMAPVAWATIAIISINVLIYVSMAIVAGNGVESVPALLLLNWGGEATSEVQRGQIWRLVTAMFLHANIAHIAFNMIGLVNSGLVVERLFGWRPYLVTYVGSGLLGSALSLHFSSQIGVSVGASGAVFGITGALLVGMARSKAQLPKSVRKRSISSIAFFIIYSLFGGLISQGVDNAAHIGGLIGGALCASIIPLRLNQPTYDKFSGRKTALVAITSTILAAWLLVMAAPAKVDVRKLLEEHPASRTEGKTVATVLNHLWQAALNIK